MGRRRRSRTPEQRIRRGRFRRGGGVPHDGGRLRALPPMPVPEPLARPGKRELDAARRLIARHGMPLVLAVAEWVSLPPSKTDKGDASGKPYDGFWRRTLTGPRSLARHWDQVCLQMADDPHGVACSPDTASSPTRAKRRSRRARNPRRRCRTTASPTTWTAGRGDCSPPSTSMRATTGSRHRAPCVGC